MADRSAPSNIYTVLALIALLALVAAFVFLWMRSAQLLGDGNQFEIRQISAAIELIRPIVG